MEIGETYIFSCHAGLNHIVFPLINKNTLFGSILVGPFLMEAPDSLLVLELNKKYQIPTESLVELYEESHTLPIVPPAKVTQLSRLLYYMFSGLLTTSYQQLVINNEKLLQQSQINESIQRYKFYSLSHPEYPYEMEKELIAHVKTKDAVSAKASLNALLGYVFFSEGNNLSNIKARATELCALLSRAAIEGGAINDAIFKINNYFLRHIQDVRTLDALCLSLQETLDSFMENMFQSIPERHHDIVKKAIT